MRFTVALVATAAGMLAREQSLLRTWSRQLDEAKKTPLQRVRLLLTNMKVEIEKEKAKDAELFAKMQCWCKTNKAEKETAVSNADAKIQSLTGEIQERAARTAQLDAEIAQHKKETKKAQDALDSATEIREKGRTAFRDEDREAAQAVINLKNAITVLSKHHKGLLQLTPELKQAVDSIVRESADKRVMLQIQGKIPAGKKVATALLQTETSAEATLVARALQGNAPAAPLAPRYAARVLASFVQGPSELAGYNSQSSQIFGILESMLEEFQSNMQTSAEEEATAEKEFKELKAAKEAEIAAGETAARDKTAESANNAKALADAKEDLEETRAQRSADVEFLSNLNLQCQQTDKDYELRLESRNAEIAAVSDALTILTEDDNREQTVKAGAFVQVKTESATRRARAVAVLKSAAKAAPQFDDLEKMWSHRDGATPKQQLSTLAVSTALDNFARVKEAMDQMIEELTAQQQDEVEHRDYCTKEFNQNDKNVFDRNDEKGDLQRKIQELTNTIATLTQEIADHNTEIAATQVSIKKAGEDREAENADFQTTVADQRATQQILDKVVQRLGQFYKKALLQQEPPVKFGEYKANQGSSSVLALLDKIIEDSKTVESEAISAEKAAQAEYESVVAASNAAIKANQEAIAQKSDSKASANADKSAAESDLQKTQNALDQLAQYRADLHASCDFTMKNFEVRQTARREEMDAIRQAKAILSGAQ